MGIPHNFIPFGGSPTTFFQPSIIIFHYQAKPIGFVGFPQSPPPCRPLHHNVQYQTQIDHFSHVSNNISRTPKISGKMGIMKEHSHLKQCSRQHTHHNRNHASVHEIYWNYFIILHMNIKHWARSSSQVTARFHWALKSIASVLWTRVILTLDILTPKWHCELHIPWRKCTPNVNFLQRSILLLWVWTFFILWSAVKLAVSYEFFHCHLSWANEVQSSPISDSVNPLLGWSSSAPFTFHCVI